MDAIRRYLKLYCIWIVSLSLTASVLYAEPVAPLAPPKHNPGRVWNLKNVDILTVINELAKETGKNFVVSPQVVGKVTFVSSYALNTDELYQAFLALLAASGFEAIPSGPVVKILPSTYSKEEGTQLTDTDKVHSTDAMAVTVARVKYTSATELVKILKQLSFHFGYVDAYAPTNDIIISDRANNINRLLDMIQRLDKPSSTRVDVVHLMNAQASDLIPLLTSLLQQKGEGGSHLVIAADDRSNDILIRGGTPEQQNQVRSLLRKLDVPLNKKGLNTEVIYLKYLSAEKAAVILNSLIESYKEKSNKNGESATPSTTSAAANEEKSAGLKNFAQLASSNNNPGTGMPNNTYSNNTAADFTNMERKQPRSGSVSPFVQWEESTNTVIVSATPTVLAKLRKVIAKIDIRRPQVLIEAIIAEVEEDRANELGVELNLGGQIRLLTRFSSTLPLSGIGANNSLGTSNPLTNNIPGQGLSAAVIRGNKLRFLLRALEKDSRSNILSTPNLVTLDNEPAQIKVGQRISFSIGSIDNNPTGGNPTNFYNQEDVGLTLTINPQITPDGSIKLIIEQELSSVLPGQTSAGSNPNLSQRFIHTTVMANDGDVIVLGGLIQNVWQDVISRVPVLGNLPLLGFFFRSHSKELTKQNLMIFLRSTILYEDKETVCIVGGKYENLRQQQLQTTRVPALDEPLTPPALPVWGQTDAILPPPFMPQTVVG